MVAGGEFQGVYVVVGAQSKLFYVGSTKHFEQRFKQHVREVGRTDVPNFCV